MRTNNIWPWLFYGAIFLLIQSLSNPFFVFQEFNYLAQPYDARGLAKGGIFFLTFVVCITSICSLILTENKGIFSVGIAWIWLALFVDFFIQSIGSPRGFSLEELKLAFSQYQLATNMVAYITQIGIALIGSLVICVVLAMVRKKIKLRVKSLWSVATFFLALTMTFLSVNNIYSVLYNAYPAPIKLTSILTHFLSAKNAQQHLLDQTIKPVDSLQSPKNIIWIIDESATGSYMSVNGYHAQTTPFLDTAAISNPSLINLGVANSISNCSNTSNYYLRVGLTPDMNFSDLNTLPSIISYGKNAGYKVIMLDAQITKGELTNYISSDEINLLDEFYTLERDVLPHERDSLMNKILIRELSEVSDQKKFIIYIKFGCHWPYPLNFKNEEAKFKPIQPTSSTPMTLENRDLVINTYLNSIYFNVDRFMKKMVENIDPVENFVFYTSDHGQSILEMDRSRTHCSSNMKEIPSSEFDVPLILYSDSIRNLKKQSGYSQIQVFPTTLQLMGYPNYKEYGFSLFEGSPSSRKSYITGTGKLYDFR